MENKDYSKLYQEACENEERYIKEEEQLNLDIQHLQHIISLAKAKSAMGDSFDSFGHVFNEYDKLKTEEELGENLIKQTIYLNCKNILDIEDLKKEIAYLKRKRQTRAVVSELKEKETELSKLEAIKKQNRIVLKKAESFLSDLLKTSAQEEIYMESVRSRIEDLEEKKNHLSTLFSSNKVNYYQKLIDDKKKFMGSLEKTHRETLQKIEAEKARRNTICEVMDAVCEKYQVIPDEFRQLIHLDASPKNIQKMQEQEIELTKCRSKLFEKIKYWGYKKNDYQLDVVRTSTKNDKIDLVNEILSLEFDEVLATSSDHFEAFKQRGERKRELHNKSMEELQKIYNTDFISAKTNPGSEVKESETSRMARRNKMINEIIEVEFANIPKVIYDAKLSIELTRQIGERKYELHNIVDDDKLQEIYDNIVGTHIK